MGELVSDITDAIFGNKPDTPDYSALADKSGASTKTNQVTPYGNMTWKQNSDGTWTISTDLSDQQKNLLNQDYNLASGANTVANGLLGYLNSNGYDPSSLYNIGDPGQIQQEAADTAYKTATRYLDPQYERSSASLESKLANQGITQGSEAYNNAWDQYNEGKDKAYDTARNEAYLQGLQGANQQFNQAYQLHNQDVSDYYTNPTNLVNALRSGSTVNSTTLPTYTSGGTGTNYSTAAQNQFNAEMSKYNANAANTSNLINMIGSMFLG